MDQWLGKIQGKVWKKIYIKLIVIEGYIKFLQKIDKVFEVKIGFR